MYRVVSDVASKLSDLSGQEAARRSAPAKWSRKEILGHLIDSAANNHQKFVRAMQQPHLEFPGYQQDDWVSLQKWRDADWEEMIALWKAYNNHLAFLIRHVDTAHLKNEITIEGAGPFTLAFVMQDYVEHLKHHVKQIFPEMQIESKFVNVYKR